MRGRIGRPNVELLLIDDVVLVAALTTRASRGPATSTT